MGGPAHRTRAGRRQAARSLMPQCAVQRGRVHRGQHLPDRHQVRDGPAKPQSGAQRRVSGPLGDRRIRPRCGPRLSGGTCAALPRSRHPPGRSPATGSTPAATGRPTTPLPDRDHPAELAPTDPRLRGRRTKEACRRRKSSAVSTLRRPARSIPSCARRPANTARLPGTAWPSLRLPHPAGLLTIRRPSPGRLIC